MNGTTKKLKEEKVMYQKFARTMKKLLHNEKGMTGLETAIILIAFVTVASVLAYSVLSAGIFSAEKGKSTVYQGLQQAQSTMEVRGAVLGLSTNNSQLNTVQFNVGLTIPNETVDSTAIVINYWDESVHDEGVTYTAALASGSTERGTASVIEQDEEFTITVTIPADASPATYDTFNLQVIPPTGASLTINRTLPSALHPVMNLN
jgi:flagellin FlaB